MDDVRKSAVLTDDGVYRYRLERVWNEQRVQLGWCMLNPSTADAEVDDMTIKKCMKYARRWGFGGIVVVNLFAFRSRHPDVLTSMDPIDATGPENYQHVSDVVGAYDTVAAWGAHKMVHQSAVRRAVGTWSRATSQMHAPVLALRTTLSGEPCHPLYLPDDLDPFRWSAA